MNDHFKPWPTEELNTLKSELAALKERIKALEKDLTQCMHQRDALQLEIQNTKMQLAHLDR